MMGEHARVEAAGVTARAVIPAASTRFGPQPPALLPQNTAQNTRATGSVF
jgi:hypothetical protein